MSEQKFKVGDRIVGSQTAQPPYLRGAHGVVTSVYESASWWTYTVRFDCIYGGERFWPMYDDKIAGVDHELEAEAPQTLAEALKLPVQRQPLLPSSGPDRKAMPIATGVIDYFPLALAYVARVSKAGNDQHNPGQPLHWAKDKSKDHADCIARHLIDRGTLDTDGLLHEGHLAWRALALLETALGNGSLP